MLGKGYYGAVIAKGANYEQEECDNYMLKN
jgi:hypothetical protein